MITDDKEIPMDFRHGDLTEKIIGCFFEVYNRLGFGFLEKVYEKAMMIELSAAGLSACNQYPVPNTISHEGSMKTRILFAIILAAVFLVTMVFPQQEARLLRFPAIHGKQIVFTYAGDLYSVSASGGVARKLTNDIGFEMFAHFSPDGKQIAFTAQYDGNTEVYLMPSEGGVPKRLTFTARSVATMSPIGWVLTTS